MEITVDEVRGLVESLPIGLYCRRRIPVKLDLTEETSFYVPAEDIIVISYRIIAEGLKNVVGNSEEEKEVATRSMVYHELSHAILTPNKMKITDAINIFEDERIETILKDFYLDVDFKKQVLAINGGVIRQPQNAMQGFYNLVRFRVCDDTTFLQRVADLIEKYKDLNRNSGVNFYADDSYIKVRNYTREIEDLYEDFAKSFPNLSQPSPSELNQIAQNMQNGKGKGVGANQNIAGQGATQSTDTNDSSAQQNGNGLSGASGQAENGENENGVESSQTEKGKGGKGSGMGEITDLIDMVTESLSKYTDNTLTTSLDTIISQFNKKNKGGSGMNAYSGIFNPRAVARQDYRWFERAITSNGNNKFGTFHLNLFIDNSGSFASSADRVNTLIRSLANIESKNKNFSFDVILCGSGMKETTKETRWVLADEGTSADYEETKQIFAKHQLKNTFNYNIVMYDGFCQWKYGRTSKNPFLIFDNNVTTIIVERENEDNVKNLKSANLVHIRDTRYAEHLTDEVIKALTKAFH